jgi:hypothetical protein
MYFQIDFFGARLSLDTRLCICMRVRVRVRVFFFFVCFISFSTLITNKFTSFDFSIL